MVQKKEEDILLGKKIKSIRSSLKMDQKTFSEKIGCTVSALSNWENGRNKPNDIMLNSIAYLANIPVEELLAPSLDQLIREYLEEIHQFENKQGNKKYKILNDLHEKKELLEYLNKQDYSGLTLQHGVRYHVKEMTDKYLDKKLELANFTPYSDENACRYLENMIHGVNYKLRDYFKKEDVRYGDTFPFFSSDQMKPELNPDLYYTLNQKLSELLNEIHKQENN